MLQPLSPREALEIHLSKLSEEYTESTVSSHKSRLQFFIEFCDDQDIDDLNDLTGRDILQFRTWRSGHGIAKSTLKSALDTLRVYLKNAARADGVHQKLPAQMDPPTLSSDEISRDDIVDAEQAEEILEYLRTYEYASFEHVCTELIFHTAIRRGAAHAIDIGDYHQKEQYIDLVHRPETDTPLKNDGDGERPVALSDLVCKVLDDWIAENRPDVKDDYGRRPLLTTTHGRAHPNTIQTATYAVTRPCIIGQRCPHNKNPEACDWAINKNEAHHCPSTVATHALRRGALTHWLTEDWPIEQVSDRADVSPKVLKKHYDQRTKLGKMEQRRDRLSDI